jgi:hypothetical protein
MTIQKIEKIRTSELCKIIVNLRSIIKDFNITINDDSIYKDHGIDKFDGVETILRKYLKKVNMGGFVKVSYNQKNNKGRYFADHCLSLQNIKREFRQTICHEFYDDIDMVNAHPVILLYLCKKNKIKTPYLKQYVDSRDQILKDTGLSRDEAKKLYLVIMNSSDTNINTVNDHMEGFKKEMSTIHNSFYYLNRNEADDHIYNRQLAGKKKNMKASYVNSLMCNVENNILMEIMKYYGNPEDCVLCFDGIMLRKGKRKSLNLCMKYIKKTIGIDIKIKVKEMEDVLDLSRYNDVSELDIPEDKRVYRLYKPIPIFNKIPNVEFNRKYVCESKTKSYFSDDSTNIVLKSDTGTGKTYAFSLFAKETKCKFLSIVSLTSVADQQYKTFQENDVDSIHYKLHFGKFRENNNILITLDSIHKIRHFDFSQYVLYLDEFSSLIEYLHTSTTLNDKRTTQYNIFIRMIKKCKKVICTDADIGNVCLKFLDELNIKYDYHRNDFNNCQDVEAVEVSKRNDILHKVMKLKKFLICTDSATVAEGLSKDLNDPDIVTITAEYKGVIDISKIKKLIISPKVLYGADSLMKREVFCIFKEQTISSKQMIQQLNRCRNITKIWYYFPNKKITPPKYESIDDVKYMIDVLDTICDFEECCSDETSKLFKSIYADILYELDCVQTNKFLHFKDILKSRGVIDEDQYIKNEKDNTMATRKELIKLKLDKFDVEELKDSVSDDGSVIVGKTNDINDNYLYIPDDDLETFKEYLVDDILLSKHFNFCQFFFKKDEEDKLRESREFRSRKIISSKGQMMTLRKICDTYDINLKSGCQIKVKNNKDPKVNEQLIKLYKASFRYRGSDLDFSNDKSLIERIVTSFKLLFGNDIVKSKRIGRGSVRKTIFNIESDYFEKNETLYKFRNDCHKNNVNNYDDNVLKLRKKIFNNST